MKMRDLKIRLESELKNKYAHIHYNVIKGVIYFIFHDSSDNQKNWEKECRDLLGERRWIVFRLF